jgi:two-component system chemotaxis response regulator CheB
MTKILVVDDSALMRKQIKIILDEYPEFQVEFARNGRQALEVLETFNPDVITLDINMPEMDGLTCLSHIMTRKPTPVIMFSSLTEKGAMATLESMALGAVDYVLKPGGTISLSIEEIKKDLIAKIKSAARSKPKISSPQRKPILKQEQAIKQELITKINQNFKLVLIGVSTGGPRTLEEIIPVLPSNFLGAVVVCQHMPEAFTAAFSTRLNSISNIKVQEITAPTKLLPGNVYIAKGGHDVSIVERDKALTAVIKPMDRKYNWHPSVEHMVETAISCYSIKNIIGVMLTGMGDDGAAVMSKIHKLGGKTIAESEESSVVFGMPNELIKHGGATEILHSCNIADKLVSWTM